REQANAGPKHRAARPARAVSEAEARLRDYRLDGIECVSPASLDGLVVRNRRPLAEFREWYVEPGKAVIHAERITSALKPEGSRYLQTRSNCPLVLNIASDVVQSDVKYGVAVEVLCETVRPRSRKRTPRED